ncbi:hypothetical protein [Maledivibacter halophilus]|uniref:Ethanolamine utilization protein n=1 Tax=Maledivibacter halophilus TaxID=36842 RepID=A0A1T5IG91_9FIRM|nr:hypothetical protein [Maledivibacter halophilus]SKC38088.1 ethanolamine utilization protein [Maledivibacter halophilus]
MDMDSLVKIITKEVLKKIDIINLQKAKVKSGNILILDSISKEKKDKYEYIIGINKNIKFLDDFFVDDDIDSLDYIIVPNLSIKDLSSIAIGLEQSQISKVVIDSILHGKKVVVIEEGIDYRKFRNISSENFFQLFKSYEDRLVSFGIDIVKKEELLFYLSENTCVKDIKKELVQESFKNINQGKKVHVIEATISKKAVSEGDIKRIWDLGYKTIYLNKKSIITPLAKDYIRTNEIEIKRINL